jgi:hypothetical protein
LACLVEWDFFEQGGADALHDAASDLPFDHIGLTIVPQSSATTIELHFIRAAAGWTNYGPSA